MAAGESGLSRTGPCRQTLSCLVLDFDVEGERD